MKDCIEQTRGIKKLSVVSKEANVITSVILFTGSMTHLPN